MTDMNQEPSLKLPEVPQDIIDGVRAAINTDIDYMFSLLPSARARIEAQWAEGVEEARYAPAWGTYPKLSFELMAAKVIEWMSRDYGEGNLQSRVTRDDYHGIPPELWVKLKPTD